MPRFKTTFRVDFADVDYARIVNYSRLLDYFWKIEEEMYRSLNIPYEMLIYERDISFPRIKISCKFLSPLRFGDVVEGVICVSKIGKKSITYRLSIYKKEKENKSIKRFVCGGSVTSVCVKFSSMKSIPIPEDIALNLLKYRCSKKVHRL